VEDGFNAALPPLTEKLSWSALVRSACVREPAFLNCGHAFGQEVSSLTVGSGNRESEAIEWRTSNCRYHRTYPPDKLGRLKKFKELFGLELSRLMGLPTPEWESVISPPTVGGDLRPIIRFAWPDLVKRREADIPD